MNALNRWWGAHVQKTLGTLLVALASVDLLSALAGLQSDITTIIGAKAYAALRCVCGALIVLRAVQARKQSLPPPAAEATR